MQSVQCQKNWESEVIMKWQSAANSAEYKNKSLLINVENCGSAWYSYVYVDRVAV